MDFNWGEILFFTFGWFLGGIVNGITGFGAAMVAMPLVLMNMNITTAVPACSLMALVMSLEQLWRYHNFTDWKRVIPIILGAIPGAFAGAVALTFLDPAMLKGSLGIFLFCYALWGSMGKATERTAISSYWGAVAGFFATTFGTAFSFNGPPLAVYATLAGWDKLIIKAGLATCFVITGLLMITSQVVAGLHGIHTFSPLMGAIPSSIFGAYLGFRMTRRMTEKTYRMLLFLFIGATGILFMYQSL